MNRRILYLIIFFLIAILYGKSLSYDFTRDDIQVFTQNDLVQNQNFDLFEIFSTPRLYGFKKYNDGTYRPFTIFSHSLDYRLFGKSSFFPRLINLVLYLLICILIYECLVKVKMPSPAIFSIFLFICHPIHSEVVINIKGRDELLSLFFLLLTTLYFLKSSKPSFLSLFGFLIACFCKETSILFAIMLFGTIYIYTSNLKITLKMTYPYFLIAYVFILVRLNILKEFLPSTTVADPIENPLVFANGLELIATPFSLFANYIKLLIIPYPLNSDYSYQTLYPVNFTNINSIIGLLIFLIIAVSIFLLKKKKFLSSTLFCFLVSFSISLNFIVIGTIFGERLAFLASLFFCVLVALTINYLFLFYRKIAIIIIFIICSTYSIILFDRVQDWKDDKTLITKDLKNHPLGVKFNRAMAIESMKKQDWNSCLTYLDRALKIFPKAKITQVEMLKCFLEAGKPSEAENYFYQYSLEFKDNPSIVYSLAMSKKYNNKHPDALAGLKKTINLAPDFADAYKDIAIIYEILNDKDMAEKYYAAYRKISSIN